MEDKKVRKHSEETIKKLSKTWFKKGHPGFGGFLGSKHSDATKKHWSSIRTGRKLSEEHKRKVGLASLGRRKANPLTPLNNLIRKSAAYKQWRTKIFERDNYTCVFCGIRAHEGLGKRIVLHADHIKPFALFPELRISLENGRTLCVECHKKTPTYGHTIKQMASVVKKSDIILICTSTYVSSLGVLTPMKMKILTDIIVLPVMKQDLLSLSK